MQRTIDALVESLREFAHQPDYPTLVLNSTDAAMTFPHRILASFDRQDEENYYLLFPQPCTDAQRYLSDVVATIRVQLEVLAQELAARQLESPPALPLEVEDERLPLGSRLKALAEHLGQWLPADSPIVWALLPGELSDVAGYRALVDELLAHQTVAPWLDRHRFIIRDRQEAPTLVTQLREAGNDRLLVLDLELDNQRVTSGLASTAMDPLLPPDDRMLSFFQLAGVDMAFQRYAEAVEKYGIAFNYYQSQNNRPMQALCLTSAGDTLRQAKSADLALERYQQSLAISVEDQSTPLIRSGAHGAGLACLDLGRNEEAEGYLGHANAIAGKLHDPYAKCDAMEQLGVARYRQHKVQEAVDSWLKGKELALQFGYEHRARAILEQLTRVCEQQGLSDRADSFRREWERLKASETAGALAT